MRKIFIIILLLSFIFTLAACGDEQSTIDDEQLTIDDEQPTIDDEQLTIDDEQLTIDEAPEEPTAITTELTVWGMVCVRCENKIKNELSKIDGIISVSADSNADKVTVVHEPDLDIAVIEGAITGEGFNIP
jgi:copper chaperone CopZ/predicted small lipoprotein YifL